MKQGHVKQDKYCTFSPILESALEHKCHGSRSRGTVWRTKDRGPAQGHEIKDTQTLAPCRKDYRYLFYIEKKRPEELKVQFLKIMNINFVVSFSL